MNFQGDFKIDTTLDKNKAWLVTKGFLQADGIALFETFSSVVKPTTIRVVLTLAMSKELELR